MIADGEQAILAALDAAEMSTRQLTKAIASLKQPVTVGSGKWRTESTLASRLLLVLAAEGTIVRTRPVGSWRSGQYRWMARSSWFGSGECRNEAATPDDATAGLPADAWLLQRYLARFGPASWDDLRWWTGWRATKIRRALEHVELRDVALPDGADGLDVAVSSAGVAADHAAHDNLDTAVALLPALDPTAMGWKHRAWYLPNDADELFDRNGNVGPTVWVAGAMVGAWAQTADGTVAFELMEKVTPDQHDRITAAARQLESALDGHVVTPRFRVPAERRLAAGQPRSG